MDEGPNQLATRARILRAALDSYVGAGIAVPSVRGIAAAAGVSAGSVQHFFPSQSALRAAVNDYVVGLVDQAFGVTLTGEFGAAVEATLDERLTSFYAAYPLESRYLARTLIDGDETAAELFAALMRLSTEQWKRLDTDDALRDDVDLTWAALQVVIVTVGTVLFAPLIDEYLGTPLSEPAVLARWQRGQTALFTGLYAHIDHREDRTHVQDTSATHQR
jgi:AcrR family transcriptional regulator